MRKTILTLILGLSLLTVSTAFAYAPAAVTNNEAVLNFPESVAFPRQKKINTFLLPGLHRPDSSQLTVVPTPTFVPAIVPVSGALLANQITPTPIPTSSSDESSPEAPVRTAPPLWLTLTLLGMCCVFLILIGIVILGFVVRNQNSREAKNVE